MCQSQSELSCNKANRGAWLAGCHVKKTSMICFVGACKSVTGYLTVEVVSSERNQGVAALQCYSPLVVMLVFNTGSMASASVEFNVFGRILQRPNTVSAFRYYFLGESCNNVGFVIVSFSGVVYFSPITEISIVLILGPWCS